MITKLGPMIKTIQSTIKINLITKTETQKELAIRKLIRQFLIFVLIFCLSQVKRISSFRRIKINYDILLNL